MKIADARKLLEAHEHPERARTGFRIRYGLVDSWNGLSYKFIPDCHEEPFATAKEAWAFAERLAEATEWVNIHVVYATSHSAVPGPRLNRY